MTFLIKQYSKITPSFSKNPRKKVFFCGNLNLSLYIWIIKSIWSLFREKGILTLRIYQYWIFHPSVIEICFEMLKSSEHEKLRRYSSYKSPNFLECTEVFSWSPNFNLLSIPYIIHPLALAYDNLKSKPLGN